MRVSRSDLIDQAASLIRRTPTGCATGHRAVIASRGQPSGHAGRAPHRRLGPAALRGEEPDHLGGRVGAHRVGGFTHLWGFFILATVWVARASKAVRARRGRGCSARAPQVLTTSIGAALPGICTVQDPENSELANGPKSSDAFVV